VRAFGKNSFAFFGELTGLTLARPMVVGMSRIDFVSRFDKFGIINGPWTLKRELANRAASIRVAMLVAKASEKATFRGAVEGTTDFFPGFGFEFLIGGGEPRGY
jgi:hypothetical protein